MTIEKLSVVFKNDMAVWLTDRIMKSPMSFGDLITKLTDSSRGLKSVSKFQNFCENYAIMSVLFIWTEIIVSKRNGGIK